MKNVFAILLSFNWIFWIQFVNSKSCHAPSLSPSNNPYYRGNPQNAPPPPYDYDYPNDNDNIPYNNNYPNEMNSYDQFSSSYAETSNIKNPNEASWSDDEYEVKSRGKSSKNNPSSNRNSNSGRRNRRDNKNDPDFEQDRSSSKSKPENEIIVKYTKSILSSILVAFSASLFLFLFSNLVVSFTIAKVPIYVTLSIALVAFIATFIPNEIGNFSRASGVFLILVLQEQKLHLFLMKLLQYLLALIMMTKRKGFPDLGDPWKYKPSRTSSPAAGNIDSDTIDDDRILPSQAIHNYSMVKILIVSSILGSIIGGKIAKPIPLFPNWIGAIIGAGFTAYTTTFPDSLGDLLR